MAKPREDGELALGAIADRAVAMRADAERKALDSLGRYKFEMFGYWAAIWVDLNRVIGDRQPNPFRHLVKAARSGAGEEETTCPRAT